MIAFEISRNGNVIAVAGADDLLNLNAVLMGCGDLSGATPGGGIFSLDVRGITNESSDGIMTTHEWDLKKGGEVELGDTISIRVIEVAEVTPPSLTREIDVSEG